jgi:hypothetical protein
MQKPKSEEWVLRAGGSDTGLHAAGSPWAGALRFEKELGSLSLFDGHAFCQISGLIDIGPTENGDVIRQ